LSNLRREEVRGWIVYYDKDIIRITRDTQPNFSFTKSRVKYSTKIRSGRQQPAREAKAGVSSL
jgi:hypothetical protein